MLSATTTKREAKSYIARFKPSIGGSKTTVKGQPLQPYLPFHIALVKIRAPQELDETLLQGLAHTLSQLDRLGLTCIIVLDCEAGDGTTLLPTWRQDVAAQADRLVSAIEAENSAKARRLDYVIGVDEDIPENHSTTSMQGRVHVQHPSILIESLRKGTIPIIPAIGYTIGTQRITHVQPDELVLALARQFSGILSRTKVAAASPEIDADRSEADAFIVDRIIILDPLGGLPSAVRPDHSHIFINLEQEYGNVRAELLGANISEPADSAAIGKEDAPKSKFSIFGASNPFTQLLETEEPLKTSTDNQAQTTIMPTSTNRNVMNLDLLQKALAILPPSSSALLTTPQEAATLNIVEKPSRTDLGVITRRPKNPLIYNLLTDRPLVSSSLPASRIGISVDQGPGFTQPNKSTFVKRGMPLTMIPDPRIHIWQAPDPSKPQLSLEDPRLDLPRLLNLIEDSFNRPLNAKHYLDRIRNRIAGVIVAGEYEGGAILTWELPPGVPDDGSEESRRRMVPYLDKFAVLKRSQGAGGVADIVFSAMVRICFPHGVCWRSRKDNPANKWYFERSTGTRKLPDSNWAMFWTTEGLHEDKTRFQDYESVCLAVQPSWADNPKVLD